MCCVISGLVRCDQVSDDTVVQLNQQYPEVFLSTVLTEMNRVFNKAGNLQALSPPGIQADVGLKWRFIKVRAHSYKIYNQIWRSCAAGLNVGYTSLLYGLHSNMISKAIRVQDQYHHDCSPLIHVHFTFSLQSPHVTWNFGEKMFKSLDQFSRPGESIGVTVMPGESMRFSPTCNKLV